MNTIPYKKISVKVYHGYGHTHNLVVYGHVFGNKAITRRRHTGNILSNILHLLKLFFIKPLPGVKVQLHWRNQCIHAITSDDGFFKFEWASEDEVSAGWHPVVVNAMDTNDSIIQQGEGEVYVPHSTQFAFISDIDDTVMISHSATMYKRIRVLFTRHPRSRKAFADVVKHYHLLALGHTSSELPNPFFYVSSSEWNLYYDLTDFFEHNGLPRGCFLLAQAKQWHQLLKTGNTKHEGKLLRVYRIMDAFPRQKFVLFGDNSQADPAIYSLIAGKHPEKIFAVYIRNISEKNEEETKQLLRSIEEKNIHTCFFKSNTEAISHSISIGLIDQQDFKQYVEK